MQHIHNHTSDCTEHRHDHTCNCGNSHHHHHDEHEHHHHEHGHHHHHHHHANTRHQLTLIVSAALLLALCIFIEHRYSLQPWQLLLLYLIPYLTAGLSTLRQAAHGILHGELFDEHFLMSIATIGALLIGFLPGAETQFPEAVFVMLFFQVGQLFEAYAEARSHRSISHLLSIRPDTARLLLDDGTERSVHPNQVDVGQTIVLRPGDRVPLDGIVTSGTSALDTVALTGESMPRAVGVGDEVLSGTVNQSGVLHVRVTKTFGQSTASRIIDLVEDAAEHKSHSEAFITRFARVYTPIVVFAALALALLPPLLMHAAFATWLYRALLFLVVSCPCALVISVPLSFFGGIGCASRHGILIKGSNYIDALAHLDAIAFDKTGTLTQGHFAVQAVHNDTDCSAHRDDPKAQQLLHLAAHVEHHSTHPIAEALRNAFTIDDSDTCSVSDVQELPGRGISARVDGHQVSVGGEGLMAALGLQHRDCHLQGTTIHVAIDGQYAGHIVVTDQVKPDSKQAINDLRTLGIRHISMLTGDRQSVAAAIAAQLGIDDYHADLLPGDKLQCLTTLQSNRQGTKPGCLAFVGDGINDAPVLAAADLGIAMGGLGSDAAIEAADIVLMDDQLGKLPLAVRIARRTLRIARQNIILAIGIKAAVLILAALGLAALWMAVFADVGVTVLAVLNAMRTLKFNPDR